MFYLLTIVLGVIIISAFNIFIPSLCVFSWWQIILFTIGLTIIEIAINGFFAFIIRRALPKKWFSGLKKIYSATKKESRFYQTLAIKKWKDKVLELGCFTNFRKNKIYEPKSNDYVGRYILEANFGVVIHFVDLFANFILVFMFGKMFFSMTIPIAIIGLFLNLLPLMVLRYNLPKLHALYQFNEKRKA